MSNKISHSIIFLLLCASLYLAIWSNTDLCGGGYELFMDEQITYDGIRKIYEAHGGQQFISAIISDDQQYGRSLWYIPAAVAYIPYKVWGSQGQIIATRMTLAVILLISYLLLLYTFINSNLLRIVGLLSLITLSGTVYYSTMPKPEPFLLIFLAIYFYLFRNRGKIWGYSWLFLGLSFGAKISILPFLIFWFPLLIYSTTPSGLQLIKSIFYFVAGWLLNVPIILLGGFKDYLNWTFFTTGHGADSSEVNVWIWIKSLNSEFFYNMPLEFILLTLPIILFVFLLSERGVSNQRKAKSIITENWFMLILMTVTMIFPIILVVKRAWLIYLHIGTVFFFLSLLSFTETSRTTTKLFIKLIGYLLIIAIVINSFLIAPQIYSLYEEEATRTHTKQYQIQLDRMKFIIEKLQKLPKRDRKYYFYFDPEYFMPEGLNNIVFQVFWGPFKDWKYEFDGVIVRITDYTKLDKHRVDYEQIMAAQQLQKKFVTEDTTNCTPTCYSLYGTNNNMQIFLKHDLSQLVK